MLMKTTATSFIKKLYTRKSKVTNGSEVDESVAVDKPPKLNNGDLTDPPEEEIVSAKKKEEVK